jgi:hypothetical protein
MEEDPLIPLVHVWNNAAFDHASASASAWHAHSPAPASAREGDKENHRPEPDVEAEVDDVEAEIYHIEAEILRLSSRLHHLRTSKQTEPPKRGQVARTRMRGLSLGQLDVAAAVDSDPLTDKQQPSAAQGLKKPIKQAPAAPRGRSSSLGPLEIVATNPRVLRSSAAAAAAPKRKIQGEGGAARPILRPIKEPPVQRRRGVSLGPLEIHHGVGSKPGAAARVKHFSNNRLGAVREEEGQRSKEHAVPARPWPSSNARHPLDARQGTAASRAKARSGSMSPSRFRRQSTSKAAETRAGNAKPTATEATRGGSEAVNHTSNIATTKRPAGSSKVRVVPSRYSIPPGSSLAAVTQGNRCKQSLPGSATETRVNLTEPPNDELSPEELAKVAELLPRIRTMPPSDESPRDSGCAKRVADLVGKRSFFTAAGDDGNLVTPYQARVVELESPEAAAEEAEA